MIYDLLAAVAFLTRVPVGRWLVFDGKRVARSQRFFPLVGALIGALEAALLWFAVPHLPALVAAVLVLALDAWLTGAMHLDGLADTADGFGGGATREDVLRIMRDHAIGSYGAVAVVLALALKAACIASLTNSPRAIAALIVAAALGRWSAVLSSAMYPYARPMEEGGRVTAGSPARFVGRVEVTMATILAAAIAGLFGRWLGGIAVVLAAVATDLWCLGCRARIGGVTGDTLGAGIVACECLVLLLFTAAL